MRRLLSDMGLLLDTNVLLDCYLFNRKGHKTAMELVSCASDSDVTLYYAGHSCVDLFYLITQAQKASMRAEGIEVTEQRAGAANEYAWGCIGNLRAIAVPVPLDMRAVRVAAEYKSACRDFEDDVVLAACELADVDMLVTNDRKLQGRAPLAVCTPEEALGHLTRLRARGRSEE